MSKANRTRSRVPGIVVYQRGKKWAYRLELERDPLTNERRWEYRTGFDTEDAALTAAVKAKSAQANGRRVSPSKRTVAQFFDEWLKTVRDSLKPSTHANYVDYLDAYVLPSIGKRRLQDIDVPTLNTLYRRLLNEGRRKRDTNTVMYEYWQTRRKAGLAPRPNEIAKHCNVSIYAARSAVLRYRRGRVPVAKAPGLAPKTVKNVHRMLHLAFRDAVAWRYIEYSPAEHAALPREKRKSTRQGGTVWTPEELAAWLEVAIGDRDAGMWVLAATTGMRRSELAGVERELLDLDNATLTLADTRVVVDGKADDSDGKSESARRTISLDPLTVKYLKLHLDKLDMERNAFGTSYKDHGKLMCHPDGTPLHPDTVTRRFNKIVDRAGVRRIRLHDVRHTYATVSLDSGVDPKIVSDRIGHANMAYTLQIYTHHSTGRDESAARKVAGVIFGDRWNETHETKDAYDRQDRGNAP